MRTSSLAEKISYTGVLLLGLIFGVLTVPVVVAQVGGNPGCNHEISDNASVWDSSAGCAQWKMCDEDYVCLTVPDGSIKDCGDPSCGIVSYCQTLYGGSYDPITGLCSMNENTQTGPSNPTGGTHCELLDPILCPL